jgi:hypothetical protein
MRAITVSYLSQFAILAREGDATSFLSASYTKKQHGLTNIDISDPIRWGCTPSFCTTSRELSY